MRFFRKFTPNNGLGVHAKAQRDPVVDLIRIDEPRRIAADDVRAGIFAEAGTQDP